MARKKQKEVIVFPKYNLGDTLNTKNECSGIVRHIYYSDDNNMWVYVLETEDLQTFHVLENMIYFKQYKIGEVM